MAIPNYQAFMPVVLKIYSELETETKLKDIEQQASDTMNVPDEERMLMVKSGRNSIVLSRIHWASYYMYTAGLLERPRRGLYKITNEGQKALKSGQTINNKYLEQYSTFVAFQERSRTSSEKLTKQDDAYVAIETPEEKIDNAIAELNIAVEDDILTALKSIDPKRFEQIVVDLMEAMNYGVGTATRYSVDGGIDGIIDEDELGLSKIYLQAKRYTGGNVNEKEMRDFVGALATNNVNKGVFITTSAFAEKASVTAEHARNHIIRLIDGAELAKLMRKHNLGAKQKKNYDIKEFDTSYFE